MPLAIPLAVGAVGYFVGKKKGQQQAAQQQATAVQPPADAPPPPPTVAQTTSSATGLANLAKGVLRKRSKTMAALTKGPLQRPGVAAPSSFKPAGLGAAFY